MKTGIMTVAIVAIIATASPANEPVVAPASFEQDIRNLLHLTMPDHLLRKMMEQTLQPLRATETGVPDEFWQRFLEKVDSNEIIDLIVPIYVRHFTHQDIKDLTRFFESPAGRKFLEKQSVVMQESISVGQLWGASLSKKVEAELKAEGLR